MTQPQIQRASKANNVHALPPPAAKKEIEQALPADKRDDLNDLLKAVEGRGFWKGAGISGPLCFALGALTAIWLTVQLVPITSDIVSRGVAIGAAQQENR